MARLVVTNIHHNGTCHSEIGLRDCNTNINSKYTIGRAYAIITKEREPSTLISCVSCTFKFDYVTINDNYCGDISQSNMRWFSFHGILSIPHNIVMGQNNVMSTIV